MLNLPNALSLLRAPLALLFVLGSAKVRVVAIVLAMLSDCVDGHLARRYRYMSRVGAVLDPVMDKFFVYLSLAVLVYENHITPWQAAMMLTRDCFLFSFILYLSITGAWKTVEFKAVLWGKVSTAAQFVVLTMLTLNIIIPQIFYYAFILFGCLAFVEMLHFPQKRGVGGKPPQ